MLLNPATILPRLPHLLGTLLAMSLLLSLTPVLAHADSPAVPDAVAAPDAPGEPKIFNVKGRESTHEAGKIKLTIYFDFFCSHCHHFDTVVLPVLQKEYGDKLEVEYWGLPIVDPAASHVPILAFYLAEQQGKGDAMREILFQAIWDNRLDVTRPEVLLGVAQKAGLDLEAFKQGFNDNIMGKRLKKGIADSKAIGARGTPTLLIDNHVRITDNTLRNVEAVFATALESAYE